MTPPPPPLLLSTGRLRYLSTLATPSTSFQDRLFAILSTTTEALTALIYLLMLRRSLPAFMDPKDSYGIQLIMALLSTFLAKRALTRAMCGLLLSLLLRSTQLSAMLWTVFPMSLLCSGLIIFTLLARFYKQPKRLVSSAMTSSLWALPSTIMRRLHTSPTARACLSPSYPRSYLLYLISP